jgi:hypothetical protein
VQISGVDIGDAGRDQGGEPVTGGGRMGQMYVTDRGEDRLVGAPGNFLSGQMRDPVDQILVVAGVVLTPILLRRNDGAMSEADAELAAKLGAVEAAYAQD